jgi:carboxyl-terminal processing protease
VREADLTRHLLNGTKPEDGKDKDGKDKEPAVQRTKPTTQPGDAKPAELGSKDDFQLQQAIAHLKGEPVKAVSPTVAASKPAATPTN